MAVVQDKREVHLTTNIHSPPVEEYYNRHTGYVGKGDKMANSYSFSCHTWKWLKKTLLASLRSGYSKQ